MCTIDFFKRLKLFSYLEFFFPLMIDPDGYLLMELSPTTILDSNRHICEVCYKGFARKQNLTLHRRSHNLPYSLKTRTPNDPVLKKVYLCPEPTCRRNHPAHALGDFGGLKKHYLRKHCDQKNYKCDTCDKAYTVETDLRAHLKTCGKKRYICHCGARFSRYIIIYFHLLIKNKINGDLAILFPKMKSFEI